MQIIYARKEGGLHIIQIEGLTKEVASHTILKNITLSIYDGEIHGIIGASGAGKSTLLDCISTLSTFQKGSIQIDGLAIESLSETKKRHLRRNIGMIFQHFALLGRKTVFENIVLPLQCWSIPKSQAKLRVEELATLVGLQDKLKVRPHELSGGQKQRVAIARALALEPSYLFCDEATSALDPRTTQSILELLQELHSQLNLTIVMVTHEMDVIRQMCTRMSILSHGEVVESGSVLDSFLHPSSVLFELLGKQETYVAPEHTTIIAIQLLPQQLQSHLLYNISTHLPHPYSLLDAKFTEFQEGRASTLILQISSEDILYLTRYLQSQHFDYTLLDKGES